MTKFIRLTNCNAFDKEEGWENVGDVVISINQIVSVEGNSAYAQIYMSNGALYMADVSLEYINGLIEGLSGDISTLIPELKVKLKEGALPFKVAHDIDVGYDICTPRDIYLPPQSSALVDTGICIQLPKGYAGMLKSKSGLNCNNNIVGEGVIDPGYTGSIRVKLYNHGNDPYKFSAGDKIIQLCIIPVLKPKIVYVDEIEGGERGENGFGSSGK